MSCRRLDSRGQGGGVERDRAYTDIAPATPIFRLKSVGCAAEKAAELNS